MALSKDKQKQLEILVAKGGMSNRAIADKVGCDPKTVRNYIKELGLKKSSLSDLAKDEVQNIIKGNEIKKKKSSLNPHQKEIYNEVLLEEAQSVNLVMNTTQLLVQKMNEHIETNTKLEKIGVGKGFQEMVEVGLGSGDYANLAKAIDQTAITLGIAPRHANANQVNIQNNQSTQNQHVELTLEEAKKKALELGVPLSALIDE